MLDAANQANELLRKQVNQLTRENEYLVEKCETMEESQTTLVSEVGVCVSVLSVCLSSLCTFLTLSLTWQLDKLRCVAEQHVILHHDGDGNSLTSSRSTSSSHLSESADSRDDTRRAKRRTLSDECVVKRRGLLINQRERSSKVNLEPPPKPKDEM